MKAHDREWVLAERDSDEGLSLLRLMKLEASFPFKSYPERLNVIWPFRKTAVNRAPAPKESDAMERFENRICKHIEKTEQALLCIVFTEPGYREYVFHARDVEPRGTERDTAGIGAVSHRDSSRDRRERQVL